MKRYYVSIILQGLAVFHMQAMEQQAVRQVLIPIKGGISIAGPIAYGPEQYYKHLNKAGFATAPYEPLIQVSVFIKDTDEKGDEIDNNWTYNLSPYIMILSDKKELEHKDKTPIPNIIRETQEKCYQTQYQTDSLSEAAVYKINHTYFPSYIPVSIFKDATHRKKTNELKLPVFGYSLLLKCLSNLPGTCFQDNLIARLKAFTAAPRYFKWRKERYGSTTIYNPIRKLMAANYIKNKDLPERTQDLMIMCHTSSNLCPDCCSADPNSYEHGTESMKNMEKNLGVTI
jgi:hypothetical protein